ncbi:MAG: TerC family protein [Candidatus Dasytiphilus stammeri]
MFIISTHVWLSLITLIILEIILGIDNIIFISLVVAKLPKDQQKKVSHLGLIAAMLIRLILLYFMTRLIKINQVLFAVFNYVFTMHNIILLVGGLFLIIKSIVEIINLLRENSNGNEKITVSYCFSATVIQIIFLDILFSFDSVITAVGLSNNILIMFTAIIIAVIIMMYSALKISKFINHYLSLKILALAFLFLVGLTLLLEGFTIHIPIGYVYFSLFFCIFVEILNILTNNRKSKINTR